MASPQPFWIPILLGLLAACGRGPELRPGVAPRHLILVTVEGLRADHCSAYLYERSTTGFEIDGHAHEQGRALTMDDLANKGVLFRHAQAPSSNPRQSLAAIHSGLGPLGFEALGKLPEAATLAERFSRAGFRCAAFVSRSGEPLPADWSRGFEVFEQGASDLETLGPAVTFVADHDWGDQRGVFLWLHLASPAWPFEPPTFAQAYSGGEVDYASLFTAPDYAGPMSQDLAALTDRDSTVLGPADLEHLSALYDGELAFTGYVLWYTLDLVRYFTETEGGLRDTAICVAGVSGMQLGENGQPFGEAASADTHSLGVPLLLHHPRSMTGRRILSTPVTLEDLGPTMDQWFGLESGAQTHGQSLLGVTDLLPISDYIDSPTCAYVPDKALLTARTERHRLVVPRRDLGAPGDEMPASAELHSLPWALKVDSAPDPGLGLELLEALRSWAGEQQQWTE